MVCKFHTIWVWVVCHPLESPPPTNLGLNLDDDHISKRQRTDDNLIPEDEFIAQNSPNVCIKVQVPNTTEKAEWKLNGQMINLTVPLTDTISAVKTKIHEQTLMPPGKQKLQLDGVFVKDSNTLAYYNVTPGALIVLGLKERGGRKK